MPPHLPLMAPKINKTQRLSSNGRTVDVKGPIGGWDDDALAAVFTVVVSQIAADGTVVSAIGRSAQVYVNDDADAETWAVKATVPGDSRLHEGGATVAAYATYANSDGGSEWYSWTLPVRLENS